MWRVENGRVGECVSCCLARQVERLFGKRWEWREEQVVGGKRAVFTGDDEVLMRVHCVESALG